MRVEQTTIDTFRQPKCPCLEIGRSKLFGDPHFNQCYCFQQRHIKHIMAV